MADKANKKTVLFIEDEPHWIDHVADDLRPEFNILVATTVADAQAAVERTPDLSVMVVDLMLASGREDPELGPAAGLQFVEKLRREKKADVPVIVYSAYLGGLRDEIAKLVVRTTGSRLQNSDLTGPESWLGKLGTEGLG